MKDFTRNFDAIGDGRARMQQRPKLSAATEKGEDPMSTKQKTINLITWETLSLDAVAQMVRVWKVAKVTNSIEFSPEQMLQKSAVDELCRAKDWTVNITSR